MTGRVSPDARTSTNTQIRKNAGRNPFARTRLKARRAGARTALSVRRKCGSWNALLLANVMNSGVMALPVKTSTNAQTPISTPTTLVLQKRRRIIQNVAATPVSSLWLMGPREGTLVNAACYLTCSATSYCIDASASFERRRNNASKLSRYVCLPSGTADLFSLFVSGAAGAVC